MITDPFNTADTRFDEMSHPLADYCDHAGVGKACRECRRRFDVSAQWAIDYLARQEPTDAEVEAVADVLAESEDTGSIETARAALSTARAARARPGESR